MYCILCQIGLHYLFHFVPLTVPLHNLLHCHPIENQCSQTVLLSHSVPSSVRLSCHLLVRPVQNAVPAKCCTLPVSPVDYLVDYLYFAQTPYL